MGNSVSNEHQNTDKKALKLRRQSNRSTFSNRFSSACSTSSTDKEWSSSDCQHQRQDSHSSTKHGILCRLKNKNNDQHQKSNDDTSHKKPPILDIFTKNNTSEEMMGSNSSTKSTSLYSSPQSMQTEFPIIDKYTDSQMTLLEINQHHHYQQQQQQNPLVGYYDNQSISSINSMFTARTTNDTNSTLTTSPQSYSSELMLKELYMLCETSPERRRDRDRYVNNNIKFDRFIIYRGIFITSKFHYIIDDIDRYILNET